MQFSLKCSPNSLHAEFDDNNWRRPLDLGLKVGWGGFRFRDAVSRKRCEIELRWQLITNRKSYMGSRLQQKSMISNDLERQFTTLSSDFSRRLQSNVRLLSQYVVRCLSVVCLWCECIVSKRLKLQSCSFHWNVAQCRSSLPDKFDSEIRRGSPWSGGARTVVRWFSIEFATLYLRNGVR